MLKISFSFVVTLALHTPACARSVAWDKIKYADMHAKGISLVFKYQEGFDLDFDIGLYFYEQVRFFPSFARVCGC